MSDKRVPVIGKLQEGGRAEMVKGSDEALDLIWEAALLWSKHRLGEEDAMGRIIEALEGVGRPVVED